uniref:Uncharacterized protein n=1 Tax=Anguilla anguilla TaxID=7936 RepID=A0A0E9RLG9_ANGAN
MRAIDQSATDGTRREAQKQRDKGCGVDRGLDTNTILHEWIFFKGVQEEIHIGVIYIYASQRFLPLQSLLCD